WELSFSFARALQGPAMAAWGKDPSDIAGAQALFARRCRLAAAARRGEYAPTMESQD
ncbi:MAG TPA: fructose-bisphosphate aldolase class I, partial [Thiotrichales bacterium]|nr:fructose-bisphosphate aldolase class I [Thiotrichales bacterium]